MPNPVNPSTALMGHIRGYVDRKHEGVVVLFLAGSEGSGKTLTVDTFRDVNPKWKKIVATHEQVRFRFFSD